MSGVYAIDDDALMAALEQGKHIGWDNAHLILGARNCTIRNDGTEDMPARVSIFEELAWGLGWRPRERLAMLRPMQWYYLDESGEHKRREDGGGLIRLTIGGGVATCERWKALDSDWTFMLKEFGIPMFHMADFQARKKPFDFNLASGSRDDQKHKSLMNRVLDVIIGNVDQLLGVIAEPNPSRPAFDDSYDQIVAKAVKEKALETSRGGDPITMVFARHPDFKASRIAAYFDFWDDGDGRLKFGGVGNPIDLPPLQVADVVAYELSRWLRTNRPEEDRYPLRRLKEAFKIKGQHAKFLLTIIP